MKKLLCLMLALIPVVTGVLSASEDAYNLLTGHVAERHFIAGPISRNMLTQIVHAGARAPSANNRQPWHFTVVRTIELGRQIIPSFQDGNVLIIVSTPGDGRTGGGALLDCALAVENVYLAAQALGLGSRIYTGPIEQINSSLKEALALPSGHNAVALVRVGHVSLSPDAVTSASPRKDLNSIVTYK